MNTFIKTFLICFIITMSFLAYKHFLSDSYAPDLNVTHNNPIFGNHEELDEKDITPQTKEEILNRQAKKETEKSIHKCYFYANNGELVLVERKLSAKPSIENSISILLKGPTIQECKKGYYSEIPMNVDLISVKRLNNDIIVDLTDNFGNGGGSQSIENRVNQLAKTIKLHSDNKNIYLYMNGKEVEYLGGDGVYIKQPLD